MVTLHCKGFCKNISTSRGRCDPGISPYDRGLKRCGTCEIYTRFDGWYCPCCGRKLGTRPSCMRASRRALLEKIRHYY